MTLEELKEAGFADEQAALLNRIVASVQSDLASVQSRLQRKIQVMEAENRALSATLADYRALLSAPDLVRRRAAIASYLSGQQRRFDSSRQPIAFDFICTDLADPSSLTRRDLFLDEAALTRHYADTSDRLGWVKANQAMNFINRLAFRLSQRLGRRFATRLNLPADLLVEAFFYSVWSELCRIIPARHLARQIARHAVGECVVIPLSSLTFFYLAGRDFEPFWLAAELQRRKVPVAFVYSDTGIAEAAKAEGRLVLRFEPNKETWTVPKFADPSGDPPPAGRAAVVGAGIRGFSYIMRQLGDPLRIHSPYIMDRSFGAPDEAVIDRNHLPVALTIPILRQGEEADAGSMIFLACRLPHGDLGEYLLTVLGGVIVAALAHAREVVKRHGLTEAHICDHPFIESAVLAQAVRENGGKVALWPHGWGPSWRTFLRPQGSVDRIYCLDQPAAAVWRQQLPGVPVKVISNLYLPRYSHPRQVVASEPLTVIVIGNEVVFDRTPIIDRKPLEDSYRRLFRALTAMEPEVHWLCRPRSTANLNWLWSLAGNSPDFRYTTHAPMVVNAPNMLFLFPAQLSSAIFEGLGRGIPSLLVREDETVEDYVGVDIPPCLPAGSVEDTVQEITRCLDPGYRQSLLDRQLGWYETLVNWDDGETA